MTYKENELARAKDICSGVLKRDWEITTGPEREICYQSARIAIEYAAKEYEFAYFSNYHDSEDPDDYAMWVSNCTAEMEERGLISDNKQ